MAQTAEDLTDYSALTRLDVQSGQDDTRPLVPDRLSAARGIFIGLIISLIAWAAIGAAVLT